MVGNPAELFDVPKEDPDFECWVPVGKYKRILLGDLGGLIDERTGVLNEVYFLASTAVQGSVCME